MKRFSKKAKNRYKGCRECHTREKCLRHKCKTYEKWLENSYLAKPKRSAIKKALDDLWRNAVKKRDKSCMWRKTKTCTGQADHAHHIISRRYEGTRWNLENGISLCSGCHLTAHERILEFEGFIKWRNGMSEIKKTALNHTKFTLTELEEIKNNLIAYIMIDIGFASLP
jgi:5-methylcytosine-specific restriction endonuclease McrA